MNEETKQSYTLLTIVVIAILAIIAGLVWYGARGAGDDVVMGATNTPGDVRTPSGQSDNIIVYTPLVNQRVGSPIVIEGQARVFENVVNYRLRAKSGEEISAGYISANALDVGKFGPFRAELVYSSDTDGGGFIDVFSLSAKDGSEINMVSIPVTFTTTPEFIKG